MNSAKILIDLKPALDGYAGIPQETRLLFAHLRREAVLEIDGLLQHGSAQLHSPDLAPDRPPHPAEALLDQSRVVTSFFGSGGVGFMAMVRKEFRRRVQLGRLRRQAIWGRPMPLGHFRRFDVP
jgi:hypothetical protein